MAEEIKAAEVVAEGIGAAVKADLPGNVVKAAADKGIDLKSAGIGLGVGTVLGVGAEIAFEHIKDRPKKITAEIKADPRVKNVLAAKIQAKIEKEEAKLEGLYKQLDELCGEVVIEPVENPEVEDNKAE